MYSAAPSGLFVPSRFNILPPKGSTRVLMPVPEREWRAPSASVPLDQFGNPVRRTRFAVLARLHDGHVKWRGRFESRDDADAFYSAVLRAQVLGEPIAIEDLRLPTPWFDPSLLDEDLTYQFLTRVDITSTSSNAVYSDWNNASNLVQLLGAGGSGARNSGTGHATGGGSGAYGNVLNATVTSTMEWFIGAGGAGKSSNSAGAGGGDTQSKFDGGTRNTATGGLGGAAGTGNQSGGAGGTTSNITSGTAGGRGGNLTGASGAGASGGGAPNITNGGTANNGGDSSSTGSTITTTGGAVLNAASWGDGNSPLPASGSDGVRSGTSTAPSYGAGSGGAQNGGNSGNGGQGLIAITYTPASPSNGNFLAFF